MELRQLRYFCAVAEEVHFGRAAQRLNVAQPALTRQIQNLEREIGVELFERLPRGIRLTAAGSSFLADAQKLLSGVEDMTNRARSISCGKLGTVRIGYCDGASWDGIVPAAVHKFRNANPNVVIEMFKMVSAEQLSALHENKIDGGFLFNVPDDDPMCETRIVGECDVVIAMPVGHPLLGKETLKLKDLGAERFVWPQRNRSPVYHDDLVEAFEAGGLNPNIVQEINDETVALNLISTGGVIGPVTSATYARCPPCVALRKVSDLSVPLHLQFAWPRDTNSPALLAFIDTVMGLAGSVKPVDARKTLADKADRTRPVTVAGQKETA